MKRFIVFLFAICVILIGLFFFYRTYRKNVIVVVSGMLPSINTANQFLDEPLSVYAMRNRSYPGSELTIEETLPDGVNYHQYIASYLSDGLKIYGLLTVPMTEKPDTGYPVIIFNHGYIPPSVYRTTERYVAYVDTFARNGYIVFKPDYRGHGDSEGNPEGAYYSPAYATDVLNALTTLKKYPEADPNRIGMWGHSMGGNIILRDMVVNTNDIKAAVIWGGVVGDYNDLMNNWQRRVPYQPSPQEMALRNNYRKKILDTYGTPQTNSVFWNAVDPTTFLSEITTPVQLHAGEDDEEVPAAFSQSLYDKLTTLHKPVAYYSYPGGDHDISSPNFEPAMERSVQFFDTYLK